MEGPAALAKWGSLLSFCGQNSVNPIVFRFATTEAAASARASTAAILFWTEALKFLLSFGLLITEEGGSVQAAVKAIRRDALEQPRESLKLGVPSVIYALQNALLQWSSGHLSAALWQVTYQGKTLVTAAFSVVLLQKQIKRAQWLAIAIMGLGIAMVQLSGAKESKQGSMGNAAEQSAARGLAMLLLACCCSGFASVYTEMIFKQVGAAADQKKKSVWLQNMLLAVFSMLLLGLTSAAAALTPGAKAGSGPARGSMLQGFTALTWMLVVNNAVGGLLVALVIKHADNILRGFASAIATINAAVLAVFCFGFMIGPAFGLGTILVVGSTLLYGSVLKLPGTWWNSEPEFFAAKAPASRGPYADAGRAEDRRAEAEDLELAAIVGAKGQGLE